tara:strand:- start:375 stop:1307 length:933 start_codon:yes stop_codon:yes gene_type:complete
MSKSLKKVTLKDLKKTFGTKFFSSNFIGIFKKKKLEYTQVNKDINSKIIKDCINIILKDKKKIDSKKRKKIWMDGWNQNYIDYRKNPKNLKLLTPHFIKSNFPKRFLKKFIIPKSKNFEYSLFELFREDLFQKYFIKYENIYEFGCGTGINLLALKKKFSNKSIFGSDFVKSSGKIIDLINKTFRYNIKFDIFDVKKPNRKYKFKPNSLVFTTGVIEQVGNDYKKFINFLLEKKPDMVINMEPFKEIYNLNNKMDLLSYFFIKKRGYAKNFLNYLKLLESKKKIKIMKIKRTYFGSVLMDSYNYVVWKIL